MNSSVARQNKFKAGDKVFAKLKDRPHWPALILSVITGSENEVHYRVLCFGSYRLEVVKEDGICYYIKNKKLHGRLRSTSMSFESAIQDIDASFGYFGKLRKKINQISLIIKELTKWLKRANRGKNAPLQGSFQLKVQKKFLQLKRLRVECKMLKLDIRIKRCLNLVEPNLQNCLMFLNQLDSLYITSVMLLKNPEVLNTIRRVRNYAGHIHSWKMTEKMEFKYSMEAAEIRAKANRVYYKFKTLFNVESDGTFVNRFSRKLRIFREKIVGLSFRELMSLSTEPV